MTVYKPTRIKQVKVRNFEFNWDWENRLFSFTVELKQKKETHRIVGRDIPLHYIDLEPNEDKKKMITVWDKGNRKYLNEG